MVPKNYYQLMAQYNQCMDFKIYSVCLDIPDNLRKKDMGAFFKSIHSTLNHIYYGDLAWLERLRHNTFTPRKIGADRGQVTTLMKQLGHEPGITDIRWLPSLENYPPAE